MQSNKKIYPMARVKTFKKYYLKSDEIEYFCRVKKDKKRKVKTARQIKNIFLGK
jgi:hypothetical protein